MRIPDANFNPYITYKVDSLEKYMIEAVKRKNDRFRLSFFF